MARDEVIELCHDWMIQFVLEEIWSKFKHTEIVEQNLIDLGQGLLQERQRLSNKSLQCRDVVFLMLTSHLMGLRKSEDGGPQQNEYRHILRMTTELSAVCNLKEHEKSTEAVRKTVLQIILERCRQGQYTEAETLFEEYTGQLDKETTRMVRTILHAKSKPHRFLNECTIEGYLSTMREFLDTAHDTFSGLPVMITLAESYLAKGPRYKGVKSQYFNKEIGGMEEGEDGELNDKEEHALQKTLRAIRKRKSREAVLSIEQSRNDETEEEAEVEVAGGSGEGHSLSPRKRRRNEERERRPSETRSTSANNEREARSPRHTAHRTGGEQRSVERGAHTSDQRDMATASDVSTDEEIPYGESEDEDLEKSLQSRVPLKIKPFSIRRSLKTPPVRSSKLKPRKPWTKREEEEFYLAVQAVGVGRWQTIQHKLKTDRSNVQLKDKWRNIVACSYDAFKDKYGPVSQ